MVKTITLQLEVSDDRILHIPLPPDIPNGTMEVVLVIAPVTSPSPTVDLAGRWQAHFPTDFDVNAALREIRHDWEKEWLADG